MRYHLIPIKVATMKEWEEGMVWKREKKKEKRERHEGGQKGRREIKTDISEDVKNTDLWPLWTVSGNVQPATTMESTTVVYLKTKNRITMWCNNFTSRYTPSKKEFESLISKKYLYIHVHGSNSEKLTTQSLIVFIYSLICNLWFLVYWDTLFVCLFCFLGHCYSKWILFKKKKQSKKPCNRKQG